MKYLYYNIIIITFPKINLHVNMCIAQHKATLYIFVWNSNNLYIIFNNNYNTALSFRSNKISTKINFKIQF